MAESLEYNDRAMKRRWREVFHHLEMSDERFRRVCDLSREQHEEAVRSGERREAKNLAKEQQLLADLGRIRHSLKAAGWTPPTSETESASLKAEPDRPPEFDYEALISRRLAS